MTGLGHAKGQVLEHELPFEAPLSLPGLMPITRLRLFALVLMAFILFSQIGPDPFADQAVSLVRSSGDLVKQVVLLGLCALLLFAGWDTHDLRANLALPVSLLILLGYCLLSVTWAIDPGIAIRRLALTAITMWFLFRAARLLGYAYTLESLRIALVVLLVLNYATVLLSSHGIHHFTLGDDDSIVGAWRGILGHKNDAGAVCALTMLVFLFDRRGQDWALRLALVALAGLFLWFTRSKTSMSALAIAVAAGALLPVLAEQRRSLRIFLLALIAVGAIQILSIFAGDFITSLDDPSAYTGRSTIWHILLEYARTHLWTGAGFGSFWQIGNASPVWDYDNGWVAQLASAGHNAYLDLLVTIGLPGLVLMVVVMFLMPVTQVWLSNTMARPQRGLMLALITFILAHNLAESQLMVGTAFDQEMLVLVMAFNAMDRAGPSLVKRLLDRIAVAREGPSG
jgi:O-antigen ligase